MRVWVDCTAATHPLVLRPIVERLREAGHDVLITARVYGRTVGVLDHEVVGRSTGRSSIAWQPNRGPAFARSSSVR